MPKRVYTAASDAEVGGGGAPKAHTAVVAVAEVAKNLLRLELVDIGSNHFPSCERSMTLDIIPSGRAPRDARGYLLHLTPAASYNPTRRVHWLFAGPTRPWSSISATLRSRGRCGPTGELRGTRCHHDASAAICRIALPIFQYVSYLFPAFKTKKLKSFLAETVSRSICVA
jgi:hypothetical protein